LPYAKPWMFPPSWLLDSPFADELLILLEERLLRKLKQQRQAAPKSGSRDAVMKHFGVFKDDNDLEDRLSDARARRKAGGVEIRPSRGHGAGAAENPECPRFPVSVPFPVPSPFPPIQ